MSSESPIAILSDNNSNLLAVQSGSATPASTPALMVAGSDGTNSRYITLDSSGRPIMVGAGVAGTPAGGIITIQGVASGTAVSISGTVTANIGTTNGLALDASVTGLQVSQGSTTSGQKGALTLGAVTTAAPTYTTAQTSPLSLTTTGLLRIDGSGVTQPVSGTVTANAGTGNFTVVQATASNLRAQTAAESTTATSTGTIAALMGGAVTTAAPTYTTGQMDPLSLTTAGALRVDGSGVTQPVSGTVTANIGTTNGLALDTTLTKLTIAQGTALGSNTQALVGGSVTTAAPTYTTGNINPLSLTTTGLLRVDGSGVTQPVSGTVTANQGGAPWSQNVTQFGGVNISTGTGASGTGIPRVTVSNDSNILATQSGTWTVQQGTPPWSQNITQIAGNAVSTAASGIQKVGLVGNAGSTLDGTLAAGTAPTNGFGMLSQYNTSQPTPTNSQALSLQSDQSGNLLEFPGIQTKTGVAWTSSTTISTVQYPTGTTTVGQFLGAPAVVVQLNQTTTLTGGAVTFEGTYDGVDWVTIPTTQVLNPQTYAQLTNPYTFVASTNQPFLILLQGFQQIRIRLSTVITGTGSVTPFWTLLPTIPAPGPGTAATIRLEDGTSSNLAKVNAAGQLLVSTDNSSQIQLTIRYDATVSLGATQAAAGIWVKGIYYTVPNNFKFSIGLISSFAGDNKSALRAVKLLELATYNIGTNTFAAVNSYTTPQFADVLEVEVTTTLSNTAVTLTITYTNQSGTAGQTTTQTIPANSVAGTKYVVTLATGDYGVQAVTNVTKSATPTGTVNINGLISLDLEQISVASATQTVVPGYGAMVLRPLDILAVDFGSPGGGGNVERSMRVSGVLGAS